MITVIFRSPVPHIQVTLNGSVVQPDAGNSNSIIINVDFGFHTLSITNLSDEHVEIEKVLIGTSDSRKMLYLSWATDSNQCTYQPCTALWQKGMTWTLPFIFPMSNWITCAEEKFKNGAYGTDLSQDYVCYYPESLKIENSTIPDIVKDFYEVNFDFTVVPVNCTDPTRIPFMKYNRQIPENLINNIRSEIHEKRYLIEENHEVPVSTESNLAEFNLQSSDVWKTYSVYRISVEDMSITEDKLETFPSIRQLFEYLQLDVYHCFIGLLRPGQFIYPHIDDKSKHYSHDYQKYHNYQRYQGCTQLYIPIDWPAGSSLKFANVGIVPVDRGPVVLNTDYFTHSAVNTGDQDRFVLAIRTSQEIIKDCRLDYK